MLRVKNVNVLNCTKNIFKNFNKQFSKDVNIPKQADVVIIGMYYLNKVKSEFNISLKLLILNLLLN